MSNMTRHRVTLTFVVLAEDAANAVDVATVAAAGREVVYVKSEVDLARTELLDYIGPYEITAVEVSATATIRRER